ncbi:hypothetical protein B0T20DRAFT_341494, partial [Sordaria brevicollis]
MADFASINMEAVYGFVDRIELAAQQGDPDLKVKWKLILFLQNGLLDPNTRAVRPFSYFTVPLEYRQFGKIAYDWLLFHHMNRTTESALGQIGHTRPGLTRALLDGLAPHERDQRRRRVYGNPPRRPILPSYSKSLAGFYATEGAAKTVFHRTVSATVTADIPRTRRQQLRSVRIMAEALENTTEIQDNESKQVKAIKRTSRAVFECLAWRLLDSAIKMQEGKPDVLPWSTGFYRKQYATFTERWNGMVTFLRESKAAVANLLISPYWNRFAGDPSSELKVSA